MSVAVIRFSGSNCDQDTLYVFQNTLNMECQTVWQDDADLPHSVKAIVIPGGFSFGDYLRAGAMAAHRPIMAAVKKFVQAGGPVLGICNGFQILCEAKILPGVLMPNHQGRFICKDVSLKVCGGGQGALRLYKKDETIVLPIAHHDGRFFASEREMDELESKNLVAVRYSQCDENRNAVVNGSLNAIAGIFGGPNRNVLGLMPHPERASETCLGSDDGLRMLQSLML